MTLIIALSLLLTISAFVIWYQQQVIADLKTRLWDAEMWIDPVKLAETSCDDGERGER